MIRNYFKIAWRNILLVTGITLLLVALQVINSVRKNVVNNLKTE